METVIRARLKKLLAVGDAALHELVTRGIIKRGPKRGTFELESSGCDDGFASA